MNVLVLKRFFSNLFKDKITLACSLTLSLIVGISLFSSWVTPYAPNEVHEEFLTVEPFWMEEGSFKFPLGTDDLGRDFMTRLIYGGKISIGVGFLVMMISLVFGVFFGLLSGFFSKLDFWIMGIVDILMSFPGILFAIMIVAVLGPGLANACIAVSVMSLPAMIRLVRGLVLREKGRDYVESAKVSGAGPFRQVWKHILPNCLGEISVQALLSFSDGILSVAALSFLGLGAEPPLPEWGVMIADGRAYMESAYWLVLFPGICILVLVLCVNLVGERLRDAFDPRLFKHPLS